MRVGLVVPGFSADESDWCIPALRNLVEQMARHEDLRVYALRYPYRAGRYDLFGAGVTALGGGTRRGPGSAGLRARTLTTLVSDHRRRPFDLIHAFWGGETGALAALAGAILRVPVVLSLAGGELANLADIGYGGLLAGAERLKTRLAMGFAARITVGSEYLLRIAAGRKGSEQRRHGDAETRRRGEVGTQDSGLRIQDRGRPGAGEDSRAPGRVSAVRRVPLGVDTDLFRPRFDVVGARIPRLVQAASLVSVKDQATLLRAAGLLRDRGYAFRLEIAGGGPLEGRLRSMVTELDLEDRVAFCGEIPHERLPGFFAGALAYVQSSRHEAQGMALLEAAACSVPAAGTRVGVLPELEPPAAVGCDVNSPEQLAMSVASLLEDRSRAAEMGAAARAIVESEYRLERCVERFRAIYAELG